MASRTPAVAFSNGGTITATPTGHAAHDVLTALYMCDFPSVTVNRPSGWSQTGYHSGGADGQTWALCMKDDASGSDAFGFSDTQGADHAVIVYANSGRNNTSPRSTAPVNTLLDSQVTSGSTISMTGLTAGAGDDLLVLLGIDQDSDVARWTFGGVSGFSTQVNGVAQDWVSGMYGANKDNVSSGATGSLTTSITRTGGGGNASWCAWVVALAPASGGGDIGLTVANAAHAHAAGSPSLTQANTLVAQNAAHAHAAGSPSLTQAGAVIVAGTVHAHAAGSPALTQASAIVVAGAVHAHAAESPSLIQAGSVVVADAMHGHAADSPSLTQAGSIVVAGAVHAHAADSPDLTQQNSLTVAAALHAHSAGVPALSQANVLSILDCIHDHLADSPTLSSGSTLTVAAALHAHVAGSPVLTQANVLAAINALHAHIAGSPSLVQAGALSVQSAHHDHAAGSPVLSTSEVLAVLSALHAHLAGNPDLVQANLLAVSGSHHAHIVESPALVQANALAVNSALHAHLAMTVSLILILAQISRDALSIIPAEDRISLLPLDLEPLTFMVPPTSTIQ